MPAARRFVDAADSYAPDLTLLAIGTSTEQCSVAVWARRGGIAEGFVIDSPPGPGQSGLVLGLVRDVLDRAGITKTRLDAIAFDAGPGAFTGLRVGCGVAQGLGFALDRPLVPVPSLSAIAVAAEPVFDMAADSGGASSPRAPVLVAPAVRPGTGNASRAGARAWDRLVAVDARMQELYWTIIPAGADPCAPVLDIRVGSAGDALRAFDGCRAVRSPEEDGRVALLGNGFVRCDALRAWAQQQGLEADVSAWPSADRIAIQAERLWRHGRAVSAAQAAPLYVRDKVALDATEQARLREANRQRAARGASPDAAARNSR